MNWQTSIRVWGRTIPQSDWRIRNGHINRIYYIHSGEAYLEINQTPMRLRPGYLYLLPEHLPFTAYMSEEHPLDHTYFDFDAIPCFHFQEILELPVKEYPLIQKWLDYVLELFHHFQGHHWEPEILAIANSCLQELLWILSQITELPVITDTRILDTLLYIQDHLDEPLSVDALAARQFLDKHYFIRLFARSTGQPPHSYIQSKRMNRAASLLQSGRSATEVSELCSYGSYSAFARAFKDYYGCAPTHYLDG